MSKLNSKMSERQIDSFISMIVDNELSTDERTALIAAMDANPDCWRKCAVAFIDDQLLKNHFSADLEPVNAGIVFPVEHENRPTPNRETNFVPSSKLDSKKPYKINSSVRWMGSIAAALVIGLCAGLLISGGADSIFGPQAIASGNSGNQKITDENLAGNSKNGDSKNSDSKIDGVQATLASLVSIANEAEAITEEFDRFDKVDSSSPSNLSRLFEIQDDEFTAVYYSPDPIPGFILQSIVLAGHEVKLTDEKIRTPVGGNLFVDMPVFAMRIDKNSRLTNQP